MRRAPVDSAMHFVLIAGLTLAGFAFYTWQVKPIWYPIITQTWYGPLVAKSDFHWILLMLLGIFVALGSFLYIALQRRYSSARKQKDEAYEKPKNDEYEDEKPKRVILSDEGEILGFVANDDEEITLIELLGE